MYIVMLESGQYKIRAAEMKMWKKYCVAVIQLVWVNW